MHLCIQLSPWSPCASWGDQMTSAIWEEKLSKKTEPGTHPLFPLSPPALSSTCRTLTWSQRPLKLQEIVPKRRSDKPGQYCCFPQASPETLSICMVLVYSWKNWGLKEAVQFVPLTSSVQHFNHRERSGGPFCLLLSFEVRQVGIHHAKQNAYGRITLSLSIFCLPG